MQFEKPIPELPSYNDLQALFLQFKNWRIGRAVRNMQDQPSVWNLGDKQRIEQFSAPLAVRAITPTEIQRRLSHRLRQIIGRNGRVSLAQAALETQINIRTLKSYLDGTACPNVARYGRLLRVFGPEVGIELAMMLGWEPRATDRFRAPGSDVRELREAVAQAISAIDLVIAQNAAAEEKSGGRGP